MVYLLNNESLRLRVEEGKENNVFISAGLARLERLISAGLARLERLNGAEKDNSLLEEEKKGVRFLFIVFCR